MTVKVLAKHAVSVCFILALEKALHTLLPTCTGRPPAPPPTPLHQTNPCPLPSQPDNPLPPPLPQRHPSSRPSPAGRLWRPSGDPAGRRVEPRGRDLVGHRLRAAQPAGRLHENIRVQGMDPEDRRVLRRRRRRRGPPSGASLSLSGD